MSDTKLSAGVVGVGVGLNLSASQFDRLIDRLLDPKTPRKPIPSMPTFAAVYDAVIGVAFLVKPGSVICTWAEFKALPKGRRGGLEPWLRN